MKKTGRRKNFASPYFSATLPAALLLVSANHLHASSGSREAKKTTHHSILVTQSANNRTDKIQLYTDASQEKLLFSVNEDDEREYQVFVFDLYSKLVSQVSLCGKGKISLPGLPPGTYLYQVFYKDEQVQCGQLSVN